MAVLVNFKICDNAKECGGVAVCPTGALSWDEEKETLVIDNDKCIACGMCESECPIGAIRVAHDEEEYKKLKEEIDNDPRTAKDLFVDRYGATPLSEFFMATEDETIQCLLKSIPIKEITSDMPADTMFYKVSAGDKIKAKYDLTEFPSLLVFKNKKYLGKVDGYYLIDQKEDFIKKIKEILNN